MKQSADQVERVATPPTDRPLMVFDGDCSFCKRWIARWQGRTGARIEYEPYQAAAVRFPEIPLQAFQKAVHLIQPDGQVTCGAHAVFKSLALADQCRWLLALYIYLPGFALLTRFLYAFIARHRNAMDRLDRWLIGSHTVPITHYHTRFIFLRLLGMVYLVAFLSLWSQIDGLIGSQGILPIAPFLKAVHINNGGQCYLLLPTLLWFNASDAALHFLCGGGVALSILLIIGIAPMPVLALLWAFYLSLSCAGQTFLGFQWDALLLEAGFVALFFAPWQFLPRPSRERPPSQVGLWLLRWLLFRVMFLSGVLKLTSGDVYWRNLTAMQYHYFTQPLPTWTSWYFHQLPPWFQTISALYMFYAELAAPLMIFGPRRIRLVGFWSILLLQLLIAATGNYGFFNLLTMVLCVALTDDVFWTRRRKLANLPQPRRPSRPWSAYITVPLALPIVFLSFIPIVEAFLPIANWDPLPTENSHGLSYIQACIYNLTISSTKIVQAGYDNTIPCFKTIQGRVGPFRSINGYGLFRVMTIMRPEIIIEGSNDKKIWRPYTFKWKPGDPNRAPAFCAPHMPRLDWQMWFSALNEGRDDWLKLFMGRLLQGSPAVLSLLENNPFPNHPPRYIRATMYDYHFTNSATRRATGAWWQATEFYELFNGENVDGKIILHIPARMYGRDIDGELKLD